MNIKSTAKRLLTSTMAFAILLGSPMAAYAGYVPANRPTFQCQSATSCEGANYVTFNSFTNAPNYGDERGFFDGKDAGITGPGGYQDSMTVRNGQKLVLRTYIHNNADPKKIGEAAATAKNTRMQVLLPLVKKNSQFATSAITADNANPGTVSDTVEFTGANAFSMEFDTSSPVQISYRPNGTGDTVTRNLPSASFANGNRVLNANFGDWKGCFEYSALVTMTVVVKMDETPPPTPAYSCDAFNIVAIENRRIRVSEFRTTATNGATFKNATVNWGDGSAEETDTNIVGKTHQYNRDGTFTITATPRFTVNGQEVTASSSPNCVRQVTFQGDKPPVVTPPTPTPPQGKGPEVLPNAGPGEVAAMFAAVAAAGAALHRRILSRRLGIE
jgi:hypothetical protein